jgi:SAM-dependent methyltransferase
MLSIPRSIASASIAMRIVGKHYLGKKPLVHRRLAFDFLPQFPTWFYNTGHTAAKVRVLHKLRQPGATETLATCPHCGGGQFTLLATQERSGLPTSVSLCRDCALVFTNPRLSETFLQDHYREDYRDIERGKRSDLHQFMFDLQASKGPRLFGFMEKAGFRPQADIDVIDIGCGEGGLLHWFSQNTGVGQAIGFELNAEAAAYGRAQGMDIRTAEYKASGGGLSLAMLEQVLEHLSSPGALLADIAASQKPGSWLFIGVPGILNVPTAYDRNFVAYLQYGHMFHYCLYTLERLVTPFGYRLIQGDETVYALFQRVADVPLDVLTAPIAADRVVELLQDWEDTFQQRGDHLKKNWPDYEPYVKLMYESWLRSFTTKPL